MSPITRLPAKTGLRRRKSTRSAAHSARIGSIRLSAVVSGPDQRLKDNIFNFVDMGGRDSLGNAAGMLRWSFSRIFLA
jgi:hypothetical protein